MAKGFDFVKNEHEVLKFWDEIGLFPKMVEKNRNSTKRYKSLDGPITANAPMCMHHVWGRALKDAIIKYHHLKGYSQQFQNGFDAQGMWVEVEVEKLLGLSSKKDIEKYGLDKFTEKCIDRVNHFAAVQTEQSKRIGQIMDWDNSYFTNSDTNITSIWHFLKVVHEKGWLKKSFKAMPWCPRCGTSLSEHEMSGSYKELEHRAVFAKLPIIGKAKESILIWTTTPWTLSANVAVAINPENDYLKVRVKSDDALVIIGKEAYKKLGDDAIEVIAKIKGAELVGLKYERPLIFKGQNQHGVIIPWSDVSAAEGSGAVHIAPGCGAEDFELGKKHGLEPIVPIDEAARFKPEFEYLNGLSTDEAEEVVFEKLRENGKMYFTHKYKHNYPYCWRCKTNVVFRLVDGWDIATADVKPAIFETIDTVKWQPEYLRKMMEDWIRNMGDWNISRRRFYGLPLPFYPCDCGHLTVVGSKEELRGLATNPSDVDKIPHLHRPYIDDVQITCAKCKKSVKRVTDVGDCWLDAGIAPFSTKGYFEDKEYWRNNFPSNVVIEMKEQIRLWFYSQLFMSVVLEGKAPFEVLSGYGTILNEAGKKVSKTDSNNIPLSEQIENYSADAVRYHMIGANPALDMRFGPNMIIDAKKNLNSILNVVTFFNTYAMVDNPKIHSHMPKDLHVTDLWLIEAINKYVKTCDEAYSSYSPHLVTKATENFIEDLSNFYIRTNRRRFWKGERGQDKMNAYWVLYQAIRAITLCLTPITPFMSENVWRTVIKKYGQDVPESVLLADFPKEIKLDEKILNVLRHVAFIQKVASMAHFLRARENLKVRQPLKKLYIKSNEDKALKLFKEYLQEELNVKEVELVSDEEKFNVPFLVVNFKKAGSVLGGRVQELKKGLESLDDEQMRKAVASFGKGKVSVGDFKGLSSELFERKLKSKDEYVSETDGELTVVLDTTLTDELVEEGKLRELIRAIQVARQDAELDITARIELGLNTKSEKMSQIITKNEKKIMQEVLAKGLADKVAGGTKVESEIDGDKVVITFKVVK
ncbi:MAG: isoleucine--tRNA ligase [Firmicutes bacterium]|nr:isoleucine--tRNA ligase [Bacillota bacterium]